MKKLLTTVCLILCLCAIFAMPAGALTYANLIDADTQESVRSYLEAGGVGGESVVLFFKWVDDFNQLTGIAGGGFHATEEPVVEYDDYYQIWMDSRDYADVNCRLTAFCLLRESIETAVRPEGGAALAVDMDAMALNPLCTFTPEEQKKFFAIYNPVPVAPTTNADDVRGAFLAGWQTRGIAFSQDALRLVSVVLHDELDNVAFVGHAGVLLEPEKGELYFVEKLAGAMPYQVSKFSSTDELRDYLTGMYGTLYTQDVSAPPFILLNDQPL